jgi:hypothetical protein
MSKLFGKVGFKPISFASSEQEAPIVFTYSLFYVYYDQYTFIRGILA